MRPVRIRRTAIVGAVLALVLVAGGCEPILNAPPGGGDTVHETFRLGPFDLQPMGQAGDQDEGFSLSIPRPSGAIGIKSMSFDIVDENGDPVARDDAHLHHVVLGNSARRDTYCPGNERFAGAGAERNPIDLPDPYAYMVGASDRWSATWHVMNTTSEARRVYIEYDVGYQRDASATNSRPVTAFFLDVTGCVAAYDVPGDGGEGSVHTRTRTWTAPWDGYVVTAVGHLHAGGIDITLRDEARDEECTMTARYDDHGGGHDHPGGGTGDPGGGHGHGTPPHEITTCPIHYPVRAGQQFSVISRYDNSQPLDGVMGIVRAYGWPGEQ
jgi:hypothetical protein